MIPELSGVCQFVAVVERSVPRQGGSHVSYSACQRGNNSRASSSD